MKEWVDYGLSCHQPRQPRGPIEMGIFSELRRRATLSVTSRANRAALLKSAETRRGDRVCLERHQPRQPRGPIEIRGRPGPVDLGVGQVTSRANRAALLKWVISVQVLNLMNQLEVTSRANRAALLKYFLGTQDEAGRNVASPAAPTARPY